MTLSGSFQIVDEDLVFAGFAYDEGANARNIVSIEIRHQENGTDSSWATPADTKPTSEKEAIS